MVSPSGLFCFLIFCVQNFDQFAIVSTLIHVHNHGDHLGASFHLIFNSFLLLQDWLLAYLLSLAQISEFFLCVNQIRCNLTYFLRNVSLPALCVYTLVLLSLKSTVGFFRLR